MRRRQEDIDAIVGTVVVFTSARTHERAVLGMYLNTTTRFVGLLVVEFLPGLDQPFGGPFGLNVGVALPYLP